jgi:hypothetical protein
MFKKEDKILKKLISNLSKEELKKTDINYCEVAQEIFPNISANKIQEVYKNIINMDNPNKIKKDIQNFTLYKAKQPLFILFSILWYFALCGVSFSLFCPEKTDIVWLIQLRQYIPLICLFIIIITHFSIAYLWFDIEEFNEYGRHFCNFISGVFGNIVVVPSLIILCLIIGLIIYSIYSTINNIF